MVNIYFGRGEKRMNATSTKEIKTICGYCGTGCGLIVEVKDNQIVKIRGDKDAPVNRGQTCVKGSFAYRYVQADDRLKEPLLRKDGKLVPVSWGEALSFVADKLGDIKAKWGPETISMFACARATNESNYITQKFMRTAIGSNHIDGCNRT